MHALKPIASNREEIGKDSERIARFKPFIDRYDREVINYSLEKEKFWEK